MKTVYKFNMLEDKELSDLAKQVLQLGDYSTCTISTIGDELREGLIFYARIESPDDKDNLLKQIYNETLARSGFE